MGDKMKQILVLFSLFYYVKACNREIVVQTTNTSSVDSDCGIWDLNSSTIFIVAIPCLAMFIIVLVLLVMTVIIARYITSIKKSRVIDEETPVVPVSHTPTSCDSFAMFIWDYWGSDWGVL